MAEKFRILRRNPRLLARLSRTALVFVATVLLIYGLVSGGFSFVWERAIRICLFCMGLQ